MNVVTFIVTDSQAALLEEPSENAFDHAAMFSQTASVFGVSLGDVGCDAALSQRSANFLFGVVGAIREGLTRSSPPSAARTLFSGVELDISRWTLEPPLPDRSFQSTRRLGSAHQNHCQRRFCDGSVRALSDFINRVGHQQLGNRQDRPATVPL